MNTKLATTQIRTNQWAGIIRERLESGLTIDAYCAEHGLSRNAYYYWLRQVKQAALGSSEVEFAEVRMGSVEEPVCQHASEISIDVNGMTVHVEAGISRDYLKDILEVAAHVK